ncbi:MAG: glycosyltransferase [Desulfobulbus sp.]|jgi:UDP:flavonoid glycosyltransferase YjiC (YdhE family)
MRALFVVHIGETVGHLVRALAIADELYLRGVDIEIACSDSGKWLLESWPVKYKHYSIVWPFSHNSMTSGIPSESMCDSVSTVNEQVIQVLKKEQPEVVIGCPGIFSVQASRSLGIKHISILHGPYLAPVITLDNQSPIESSVLSFTKSCFDNCVNHIYKYLSQSLKLVCLTYDEYLRSETIFIPQLFLPLPRFPNFNVVPFIRASFGPPVEGDGIDLKNACYITFGSGNPCNIEPIVRITEAIFSSVIVSCGFTGLRPSKPTTVCQSFIASSSLAGQVSAVINHGGIGTVGTFAEFGTPQLIIPTEVDQACMAVHAGRAGIARTLGLNEWARNPALGRRLLDIPEQEIIKAVEQLSETPKGNCIDASGASCISDAIVNKLYETVDSHCKCTTVEA